VHRDISPENLMITRDEQGTERVKIIDLGVAKGEEGDYVATRTGIFVGKLRYSSPEHLGFVPEGERIDGRADLYSVAIVLYEMLTGRPPFESTSPHQYILHHSRETQAPALDLTKVSGGAELQAVLARALERDRTKRWATARDFAAALERVEKTLPETAPARMTEREAEPTLRLTPAPVRTTERTDIAQHPPARTVVDRSSAPPPARRDHSRSIIAVLAVLLIAVAAFALWQLRSRPAPQSAAVVATATQAAPTRQASSPASTSVDVVSTTTTAAPPLATTTTAEVHKAPPRPAPVQESPSAEQTVHSYTEGGDSTSNEEALSYLQAALHGVSRVDVQGGGDADQTKIVSDQLRKRGLTVADGSDVTIRFNGTVTRLRFGRKRRAADATISKGGRVIFRYQLPAEDYRVGDNPAEAFARVIGDAFGR